MEGPKPKWARLNGGEGGSHPSNVHDHVYAIGSINFTGDMPIALMPDGPSLGGFVCPATITSNEMWKMGQVRGPPTGFDLSRSQQVNYALCVQFNSIQFNSIQFNSIQFNQCVNGVIFNPRTVTLTPSDF